MLSKVVAPFMTLNVSRTVIEFSLQRSVEVLQPSLQAHVAPSSCPFTPSSFNRQAVAPGPFHVRFTSGRLLIAPELLFENTIGLQIVKIEEFLEELFHPLLAGQTGQTGIGFKMFLTHSWDFFPEKTYNRV